MKKYLKCLCLLLSLNMLLINSTHAMLSKFASWLPSPQNIFNKEQLDNAATALGIGFAPESFFNSTFSTKNEPEKVTAYVLSNEEKAAIKAEVNAKLDAEWALNKASR
ncbi:hypothetical protein IPH25_04120 [bacterium]|nr:MAG: hypothetical protein IPG37_01115 [bacterium]QQR61633.1 MAG: hypothetical protein IPH25_04120 [bacterium]QQR62806.1 MAG: hypothetical protein IPH67_05360 [bacterium]